MLDDELSKYKNDLLDLFNLGLENELKKGKYKAEIDLIISFSFLEKLKLNISNLIEKKYPFLKIGVPSSILGYILFSIIIPGVGPIEFVVGIIFGIISSLSIFLLSKTINKEKMLLKKISSSKDEIHLNYLRVKTKFCRLYKDTIYETKKLFKDLLTIACSDLSQIEQKIWIKLKKNYEEVKTSIIKTEKLK